METQANGDGDSEEWNTIDGKQWKRVAQIGKGSFGSVYIGKRVEDGMVFAVKSNPFDATYLQFLRNEIKTLRGLRCKHIVRMLGCGRSDGTNSFKPNEVPMLDLFLEYIPRGSLKHVMYRMNWLKIGMPEDHVRAYTADLLKGVDYLHRKQFVHGDIKPVNLLVGDCLKLADFGGCKTLKKTKLNVFVISTMRYMAPETYLKVEQGLASDIFSVGCSVLEMLIGVVPKYLHVPTSLSQDCQNFLRRCLTGDRHKRWTAAQLLEHPFIRDRDLNDTRPYSTFLPDKAESMDVQPPPIESYTNTMLSPTYRGSEPTPGQALPQPFNQRGNGTRDNTRQKSADQHQTDPFLLRLLANVAAATACSPSETSTANSIKNVSRAQTVADRNVSRAQTVADKNVSRAQTVADEDEDEDIFYTPPLGDESNVP